MMLLFFNKGLVSELRIVKIKTYGHPINKAITKSLKLAEELPPISNVYKTKCIELKL